MPIEKSIVISRIKAKHPNTNLSQTRMDEISARLINRLNDDADEAAIDAVIEDFNHFNPFTEIAKADDRMRDLEAKAKKNEPKPDPKPDDKKPDFPSDLSPEMKTFFENQNKLIEQMGAKLEGFENSQKTKSLTERFNSDERIKDVPDIMRVGFLPSSEDDYETKVTSLLDGFNKYQEAYKVEKIGNDTPKGGQGGEGKQKEAPKEAVDALVSKIQI